MFKGFKPRPRRTCGALKRPRCRAASGEVSSNLAARRGDSRIKRLVWFLRSCSWEMLNGSSSRSGKVHGV